MSSSLKAVAGLALVVGLASVLAACADLDKFLVGKSKGTVVAAPGMSFEDVKSRSSFKLDHETNLGSEKVMALSDAAAFDFELAGTGIRLKDCRYYALWQKGGDPGISEIILQATKNVSWSAVKKELVETQAKLKADGWTPAAVDGLSAEDRLNRSLIAEAPSREISFQWTKNGIELDFSARRFPQTITGEKTDVGEPYNQELEIRKVKAP